ncbi:MAG: hypothetical protein JXB05_11740 [Myxococcaceae bacterium]|nr:hypothetical protein [Myxococcaceae bacterium]
MSGHYLLRSISHQDLVIAQAPTARGIWGPLQHAAVGWTAPSRGVIQNVFANIAIPNRGGLPPHRYLQFGVENPIDPSRALYLRSAEWVDQLIRPADPGFAISALSVAAQAHWAAGSKAESIIAQIQHGNVSVEIYYVDGHEMV